MSEPRSSKRIEPLDGLRGLAILSVLCFHLLVRWPQRIPWVTNNPGFGFIHYGYLGVQLFFLVSGYVIYLTLDKCRTYREFLLRRWLRLFPAMLIGTAAIYFTSFWLWERPDGPLHLGDVIPGLLFIEPELINRAFGSHFQAVEGAFWTLFVEVKFYLIFGFFYFLNKRRALAYLALSYGAALSLQGLLRVVHAPEVLGYIHRAYSLMNLFTSLIQFGCFLSGALLYRYQRDSKLRFLLFSLMLLPANLIIVFGMSSVALEDTAVFIGLYAVFVLGLFSRRVGGVLSSRLLVFFGFISYPLYLIHENALVALTVKTHAFVPRLPGLLTPLPGIILLIACAWLMAKYLEPALKNTLKPWIFPRLEPRQP